MQIFFLILSILITVGAILFLLLETYLIFGGHFRGAPFVRSSRKRINTMLELAQIRPGEVVFDLGSGDGTLVLAAARAGAKAIGIEINPFLVVFSRLRIKRQGLREKANIISADFRISSLSTADVVFMYLLPNTVKNLQEKLLRELKPGARIVSNSFPFPAWLPAKEKDKVFLYHVPS